MRRISPTVAALEERSLLSTATITSLGLSALSLAAGQTEVFTATVTTNPPSGTIPTGGTVSFVDGTNTLATVGLSAGLATYSTTGLGMGPHVLSAVYSGTAAFAGSRSGVAQGSIISTVAGGSVGDGGPATGAPINGPTGIAEYGGNLFIADLNHNRIRMVNGTTGVITTIAGIGLAGYSGNGGPATSAMLNQPSSVAVDSSGHLYIADSQNDVVRQVNLATGIITTVAGTGTSGYSGNGGPATSAMLADPTAVALDKFGELFIADTANDVIREVSAATGKISTVAGKGVNGNSGDGGAATSAELNLPFGVAVDGAGNLFIADTYNNRVREVSASTGVITTVAGTGVAGLTGNGGGATAAQLNLPIGVALNTSGVLFIAEFSNNDVRQVSLGTGVINAYAGSGIAGYQGDSGPAASAKLNGPQGIALDSSGNLLVADFVNSVIRKVNASSHNITTVAGNGFEGSFGDGGQATSAGLLSPRGLAVSSSGIIFVVDSGSNRIREINPATGVITTVAGTGVAGYSGDGGPATAATLNAPTGIAVDSHGNLFIADTQNNAIREVNAATGVITTVAGNGTRGFSGNGGAATAAELNQPFSVAVDSSGNILIADTVNTQIREVSAATGKISTVAGTGTTGSSGDGGPATSAQLNQPQSIAVDAAGNIFIADTGSNRIREVIAATGKIIAVAGTGGVGSSGNGGPATAALLNFPTSLALDSAGNLFFADSENNQVREVVAGTNTIVLVAGTGVAGYSGDGGSPLSAKLHQAVGVAVDPAGTLYISDRQNEVIRKVSTIFSGQTVTVNPGPPPNQGPPPTIIGQSVVITQKRNAKGKKIGKPVVTGYTITFSTAMDQTALGSHASYEIDVKSIQTKLVTKGRKRSAPRSRCSPRSGLT